MTKEYSGRGSGDCSCMLNPKFRSILWFFLTGEPFWLEIALLFACYQWHTAALFPPTGALTQVPRRVLIFQKALPVENVQRLLRLFITQKILLQWLGCISAPGKLKWLEQSLSSFCRSNTQTNTGTRSCTLLHGSAKCAFFIPLSRLQHFCIWESMFPVVFLLLHVRLLIPFK